MSLTTDTGATDSRLTVNRNYPLKAFEDKESYGSEETLLDLWVTLYDYKGNRITNILLNPEQAIALRDFITKSLNEGLDLLGVKDE